MTTQNGWTSDAAFVHWMRQCLIPQLNELRDPSEQALLISDGHQSHESAEAIQLGVENNITLVRLPSHTTHKLQPLDVGVFGPIQAAWRKQTKEYMLKTADELPLPQVVREYLIARTRVMKESNIISAWKKSGLLSLDPNSFSARDYGPAQLTSTNAFLPSSYPQKASIDFDLESETASESSVDTPWTPASCSGDESGSPSSHSELAQPTAGPPHSPGSLHHPMQPSVPSQAMEQLR